MYCLEPQEGDSLILLYLHIEGFSRSINFYHTELYVLPYFVELLNRPGGAAVTQQTG